MSSMEIESKAPSFVKGLPDSRFFYRSLSHLELLAALRFGIEGRRGLILFTGDAGTGKSAVLRELARELNSQACCILISDPQVRFVEVLRLMLRTLEVAAPAEDESALIELCQTALRSHLASNRIVSLVFDDAHHLADEVIVSLTRHFVGKGFDPEKNLLQIVLAGRPELRTRLFMPPLRSLDTQVEIDCRLKPLAGKDIELYIKHRLAAAGLAAARFDGEAIEGIAFYTGGRPGAINAVCERALQLSDSSRLDIITPAVIAAAALDVEHFKPGWLDEKAPPGRSAKTREEALRFPASTAVPPVFFDDKAAKRRFLPAHGDGTAILALLVLVLLGVSAAWLYGVPGINYDRDRNVKLDSIAASTQPSAGSVNIESDTAPRRTGVLPFATAQNIDAAPPATAESHVYIANALQPLEPSASALLEPSVADKRSIRDTPERRKETRQHKDPAKQISKAIENRAIQGIHVSVVDGIAYLDGRVATLNQREAAEQAARGVSEVRGIRNRIAIE